MSSKTSVDRFSTVAHFELTIHGRTYKVAQVASDFLDLKDAATIAPGPGVLVIRVEGEEIRREIKLPHGATPPSTRVQISRS